MNSSGVAEAWKAYLSAKMIVEPLDDINATLPQSVLDIGAGPDPIGSIQFQRRRGYFSTDVKGFPSVDILCSALSLPFHDGAFDLVLCLRVLQHLRDDTRAIGEMFRVIRSGGFVLLAVGNRRSWTFLGARLEKPHWRARIAYDYYHPYDASEITQKLMNVGFKNVQVRAVAYVPEAINSLPPFYTRLILRPAATFERLLAVFPGLRNLGTNLVVWGIKP